MFGGPPPRWLGASRNAACRWRTGAFRGRRPRPCRPRRAAIQLPFSEATLPTGGMPAIRPRKREFGPAPESRLANVRTRTSGSRNRKDKGTCSGRCHRLRVACPCDGGAHFQATLGRAATESGPGRLSRPWLGVRPISGWTGGSPVRQIMEPRFQPDPAVVAGACLRLLRKVAGDRDTRNLTADT